MAVAALLLMWAARMVLRPTETVPDCSAPLLDRYNIGLMSGTRLGRSLRRLWRPFVYFRFQLLGRRRLARPVLERIGGRDFLILPQVFNPMLFRSGAFLAQQLACGRIPPDSRVLDMGTGSGVGAVTASQWASQVVAVDISPRAVRCARLNVALHCLEEQVEVREGDLFGPLQGERFDVILFNPPYLDGIPEGALEKAFLSRGLAERFALELPDHLETGGTVLMVLSTNGEEDAFLEALSRNGFESRLVATEDLWSEVLRLYRVQRPT